MADPHRRGVAQLARVLGLLTPLPFVLSLGWRQESALLLGAAGTLALGLGAIVTGRLAWGRMRLGVKPIGVIAWLLAVGWFLWWAWRLRQGFSF